VQFVRGGREYFTLITQLIHNATSTIHLQTYIFESDETGKKVADALVAAANRNVSVFVLLDGYGSQKFSSNSIEQMVNAGIHFRFFSPLFRSRSFYFGRRLHAKILVVDSTYAVVGGINITDRYNDMPGEPAWLDFALLAQGPVGIEACKVCREVWKGLRFRTPFPSCDPPNQIPSFKDTESSLVRLRRNDWVRNKMQISNSYLEMFRTATSNITILSSYALPGNVFRRNLQKAIRRGVKVRMIISAESDVALVKNAERYWYDWLLRHNIEIYEYTANVLHGKLAVCDGEWMTIGSYNVNDLSAYASIELNFDVRDAKFVSSVEETLQNIIDNDCILITKEQYALKGGFIPKMQRWFSYQIIRSALSLFTFYLKKQKS
jgi:cardiolipin synthase A/B